MCEFAGSFLDRVPSNRLTAAVATVSLFVQLCYAADPLSERERAFFLKMNVCTLNMSMYLAAIGAYFFCVLQNSKFTNFNV
jgi:hypothetical protein